jgi:hypothetical protein
MKFEEYLKKSMEYFLDNKKGQIRLGQAYFNMLPDALHASIRGTDLDPFYDDGNITSFLVYVQNNWKDE